MNQAMKKIPIFLVLILLSCASFAQIVRQGEKFTKVPLIEGKVTFLKELPMKQGLSSDGNYKLLKEWAITNYGKDPFISSVRHDEKNQEFIAKSRIELLLPANSKGIREKMIMRYRINGVIYQNKCILEITEISYLYENSRNNKLLPRVIRAEDFITDKALEIADEVQEYRINTRKSTLYFLDELSKDFESKFAD